MSEMIERVAESQAKFDGRELIAMPRTERERYLQRARAAIEAMRVPTEQMVEATDDVVVGYSGEYDHNEYCTFAVAREIWTVMIDAALQEPSK